MKKAVFVVTFLLPFCFNLQYAQAQEKGGGGPFIASCCIGPRVGLEMNEGKKIRTVEWIYAGSYLPYVGELCLLVSKVWMTVDALEAAGPGGGLAACCIGPRVGLELKERRIRTVEWLTLIPGIGIIPRALIALEAMEGKTMSEIEEEEGLKK